MDSSSAVLRATSSARQSTTSQRVISALAAIPVAGPSEAAGVDGQRDFGRCAVRHSIQPGKNGIGPSLDMSRTSVGISAGIPLLNGDGGRAHNLGRRQSRQVSQQYNERCAWDEDVPRRPCRDREHHLAQHTETTARNTDIPLVSGSCSSGGSGGTQGPLGPVLNRNETPDPSVQPVCPPERPSLSAILTRSTKDRARIFRVIWLR